MLMAGEDAGNAVRLLHKTLHEVRAFVRADAAVGHDDDHVRLFEHFRLIVLIGLDNIRKVDALPVGGDIPLRDIRVAEADDGDLNAVHFLNDIGGIAVPCLPILFLVAVGLDIKVVCHADGKLLLRLSACGNRIIELPLEDLQAVVELVIAHDPHIVADGTQRLDGRIVLLGLLECVIVSQRSALDRIAEVSDKQVVSVLFTHFPDVGCYTGQAAFIGAALRLIHRVVRGVDLTVQVRGDHKSKFRFLLLGENGREHCQHHAQHQQHSQNAR